MIAKSGSRKAANNYYQLRQRLAPPTGGTDSESCPDAPDASRTETDPTPFLSNDHDWMASADHFRKYSPHLTSVKQISREQPSGLLASHHPSRTQREANLLSGTPQPNGFGARQPTYWDNWGHRRLREPPS